MTARIVKAAALCAVAAACLIAALVLLSGRLDATLGSGEVTDSGALGPVGKTAGDVERDFAPVEIGESR